MAVRREPVSRPVASPVGCCPKSLNCRLMAVQEELEESLEHLAGMSEDGDCEICCDVSLPLSLSLGWSAPQTEFANAKHPQRIIKESLCK